MMIIIQDNLISYNLREGIYLASREDCFSNNELKCNNLINKKDTAVLSFEMGISLISLFCLRKTFKKKY